ncbi:hypothetical protein LCM4579_06335 [Ensifer sp. LCM 4579]|nr:hypothetical protein LCM4579_06335 [Ensifer sp. LCM 4579]
MLFFCHQQSRDLLLESPRRILVVRIQKSQDFTRRLAAKRIPRASITFIQTMSDQFYPRILPRD